MEALEEGFAFDELNETPATTVQQALAAMKGGFLPLGTIFLDEIAEEDLTALLPQDVKDLSCSGGKITKIHPSLLRLPQLSTLSLCNSLINTLPVPPTLPSSPLTQLTTLYLYNNLLTSISPEFCMALPNLIRLNLSYNTIRSIPPEIRYLRNLQFFWISGNQLTDLPPELSDLTHLKMLAVDGNLIERLPFCLNSTSWPSLTSFIVNSPDLLIDAFEFGVWSRYSRIYVFEPKSLLDICLQAILRHVHE